MATSSGIGSNGSMLDVSSIVSQLMAVEQKPLRQIDTNAASYQAKLSAYGSLKSALGSFQSAMSGLSTGAHLLALKATPSDTSVLTATTSGSAVPGSYSIEVSRLAQQQKLAAAGQASSAATIGTGTLTFDFGSIDSSGGSFDAITGKYTGASYASSGIGTQTVTIDSGSSTLAGIRDAINAADIGVSATIVNDGGTSPYRLVLSSEATGAASSMKISVSGDAALSNLLAHDPAGTQNLAEVQTAQNAQFKVDGLTVSKASNTVTDVIPGVTLNLAKLTTAAIALGVARDTSGAQSAAQGFVDAFNALSKTVKSLTSFDKTGNKLGVLQGDGIAMSLGASLRSMLAKQVVGAGSYATLSSVGIGFQRDGTLALDSTRLQSALAASPTDFAAVFAQYGRATDALIGYSGATSATKPGSYAVSVSQIATRATSVGSAAANLVIDAGINDNLDVVVNGVAATVTLDAGTYASADALARQLESKINAAGALSDAGHSVSVSAASDVITLASTRYGSTSGIVVAGGNGASDLFGTPTETAGVDVAGSIGGVAATGSGQNLAAAAGSDAEGLRLLVAGGATGARGSVSLSHGYAYLFDRHASDLIDSVGSIAKRTEDINLTLGRISRQRDKETARLATLERNYRAQFAALDAMLARMNSTSTYLTQQLGNLPGFTESSK